MIINLILHSCSFLNSPWIWLYVILGLRNLLVVDVLKVNNKKDKSKKNYYHITVLVKQFRCFNALKRFIAPYKGIQDSLGFWIPRRGFQIPGTGFQSLSVERGFWIPLAHFPRFLIPPAKISCIPESGIPYMVRA